MIDIKLLKSRSDLIQFKTGQVIIEDGETMCDEMYILLKGSADVYKNYQEPGEVKIAAINPGDFFGEMSLFLNKERTATIVANEDVIALMINRMNAYEFFEHQPEATYSLIKTLCSRIDNTNIAYRKLYNETHPEPDNTGEPPFPSLLWLLPEKHKAYRRTINTLKISEVVEKSYRCPLCGTGFLALTDTVSCKEPTYNYHRPAKGMSDFYYEVILCPNCWYGDFAGMFESGKLCDSLFEQYMESSKPEVDAIIGDQTGINGIFLKYFFAIKCGGLINHHEEVMARLWIRVSWLYCDCKDDVMETYAISQAQKAYIAALKKREIPKDGLMQIYFTIGELSLKINELQTAKKYFDIVEDTSNNLELKRAASEYLEDIRQRTRVMVSELRAKSSTSQ